jgi:hypothetical protein
MFARLLFYHYFFKNNSLGEAPGVQISNMGASPGETRVDSGNRTQAAALTAERLATGPTARSRSIII